MHSIRHLAIIMDGNGRWAQARGLPRSAGHKAGINAVHKVLRGCDEHKIANLTLFAFSSENWRRPRNEVRVLMDLFLATLKKELNILIEKNVRLRFVGDISAFDTHLQHRINQAEYQTEGNSGVSLNIAVNYGGRWDIVQAAIKLAQQVREGVLEPEDIDIEKFGASVCLSELPEPDLLIRTGGESRISNFLNWQLAYTELYFTNCLWPDFDVAALEEAVTWYAGRQRRFGQTPEQAKAAT